MDSRPRNEIGTPQSTPINVDAGPPAFVEWGFIITSVAAGLAYTGQWFLKQISTKEQSESDLMKGLIDNLQSVQGQLIKDSKEAKMELISHIDLKDTMSRMATLLKDDVGRALGSQGAMYARGLENQAEMQGKLDAIHRRIDQAEVKLDQIDIKLNQILELMKNAN